MESFNTFGFRPFSSRISSSETRCKAPDRINISENSSTRGLPGANVIALEELVRTPYYTICLTRVLKSGRSLHRCCPSTQEMPPPILGVSKSGPRFVSFRLQASFRTTDRWAKKTRRVFLLNSMQAKALPKSFCRDNTAQKPENHQQHRQT